MSYQLMMFDLDGTLTDPLLGFARSINYALTAVDLPTRTEDSLSQFIGPQIESTMVQLIGRDHPALVEKLIFKYRERYNDIGFKENTIYDGIRETLQSLNDTGQKMSVCTSKPSKPARLVLEHFDLSQYFEFVSGGDNGIQKWDQIQQLLHDETISSDTIMIGDRYVDMTAAHRNDLHAIGVLWGHGSKAELSAENPKRLIEHPKALLEGV